MEERKLKDVMGKVHLKREMGEEILKNVVNAEKEQEKTGRSGIKMAGWQRRAVAAAIALAVVGAGGFTVRAVVDNLVKERMEGMPKEEVADYVEEVDSRQVEADTYSRELTDEEIGRQRELSIAYQKGQFPESELLKVKDEGEVDKNSLCYVPSTGYMHLPDRALTDEEILQMIDHFEKINYALRQRYEKNYPQEVEKQEREKQELRQQVSADGGISEEEAIVKAGEWLNKLFGISEDGMKLSHNIHEDDGKPVYFVEYCIEGIEYYDFYISSTDGALLMVDYSTGLNKEEISLSDAEGKVQNLYQKAKEYLQDVFGISEDYVEVYCRYLKNDDGNGVYENLMNFWFVKEDRSAYVITLKCEDETFAGYSTENYDEYSKDREECEAGDICHKSIVTKLK